MKPTSSQPSGAPFFLWFAYIFFVVYGSLVPLQYRALSFHDAWDAFANMPFLTLGIESRADWVANGVLYVPVGFLTAYLLAARCGRVWRPLLQVAAAVFCVCLAVSVEFTQLYFPPRTVSLNDLLAELIGSFIGIVVAARFGRWFTALLHSFLNDTERLLVLGLQGFAVAYLAFAMFPFDFLLSTGELADKFRSDNWGWFLAGEEQRLTIQLVKLLAETLLTIPLGILLARLVGLKHARYPFAIFVGLVLGFAVEIGQFFIASGVSQGLSVVTRAAGVCAGVGLYRYAVGQAGTMTWAHAAGLVRRCLPYLTLPYLLVLLEVNGWMTTAWRGSAAAQEQLAAVNFMPFYYHYYTTEAIALFSLAAVAMSYMPLGVAGWSHKWAAGSVAFLVALVAGVVEMGKLFIQSAHPDPTNVLIAAVSVWATAQLLKLFGKGKASGSFRSRPQGSSEQRLRDAGGQMASFETVHGGQPPGGSAGTGITSVKGVSSVAWVGLILCLTLVTAWVAAFPALRLIVSLVLLVSGAIIWFQPKLVFAIIPAALPAFDLAPWSGRFFLDEFDVLVVVALAIAWARGSTLKSGSIHRPSGQTHGPDNLRHRTSRRRSGQPDLLLIGAVGLMALSLTIGTVRGLMPFSLPDANSFNNYFSSFNALRIVKGALWAGLIWRLSRRFVAQGVDVRRPFAWGITCGLALTVFWVIWERVAFPGLLNFNDDYRVTGPFSATHTGGAYIDCFVAAAVPFLIVLTITQRHWLLKFCGLVLILASTYVLVVTYSRSGYLAFAVAIVVVLAAMFLTTAQTTKTLRRGLLFIGLCAAILAVALPVFRSGFMQSRLATVGADFDFRKTHWVDALAIRDPDLMTAMFGMGIGRFPDSKYWRSTLHPKVASYSLQTEKQGGKDNTFLRLDAGDPIGVEQLVEVEPGQQYVLKFDVRPSHANTTVIVPICEKWLLTSARCTEPAVDLGVQKGAWRHVEIPVGTQLFEPSQGLTRPIKLSLTHALAKSTLDIDNLHLLSRQGNDLIVNGDFSQGLDRWFFSIAGTTHAHWRTHNLFVGVLFDQGWLGLVAILAVFGVALTRSIQAVRRSDPLGAASLAALSGFVLGALLDTQVDSARILLLLLLLVWSAVCGGARANSNYDWRTSP